MWSKPLNLEKLASFIKDENEQTRHHFDVVAEDLKSAIRIIAAHHGALVEKMDRMESKVDILDSRMNCLETKVDVLDSRMDRLETKVDRLETKVDGLGVRMDHLEK